MSVDELVSSEEVRDIAQAHRDVCYAHRDFLRLALLRAHDRQRENTASASSVDVPDSGSTKYTKFHENIQSVRAVIVYIV
jgi:hypothetical protein